MPQCEMLRYCEDGLLGTVSVDTFSDRKRLQKAIYLLQEFGLDLGYKFRWYLHGPYSDDLADDAFRVSMFSEIREQEPTNSNLIEALRTFLGSDIASPDTLELLASLHFLAMKAYVPQKSKMRIVELMRQRKPQFSEEQILAAWDRLSRVHLIV